MNDRYRLGGLEDDQLLVALSGLVRRENDSLSDLLAHLAELDERGLCIALGYSSLFAYCTEALGFCKSSAGRRIAAARVCREYPEAFSRVANGELQLSVLCALRPHLNAENASELFAACSRKSYEQVEELLAARFPKRDVRDLIRRLPPTAVGTPDIGTQRTHHTGPAASRGEKGARLIETRQIGIFRGPGAHGHGYDAAGQAAACSLSPGLLSTSADHRPAADSTAGQVLPLVAELPNESPPPHVSRGVVKPLSANRFSVNFMADGEFRELLEEVRALLSHAEPKGDLMRVIKRGLEALRSELLKKRFGVGRKLRHVPSRTGDPQATSESPPPHAPNATNATNAPNATHAPNAPNATNALNPPRHTRHIRAAVAREVYVRDQGRCTFCSNDGRRCGERRFLQLDHVVPHAEGGAATAANLRLRCRAHNLHAAREHFGREYVRSAVETSTRRMRFDKQRVYGHHPTTPRIGRPLT